MPKRPNTHLVNESLTDIFQSAYKRNNSIESELLCLANEIRTELDRRQGTIVVLINLSAAPDTILHATLLDRLQGGYDLAGVTLHWLKFYLRDRKQRPFRPRVIQRDDFDNRTAVGFTAATILIVNIRAADR